MIEHIFMQFLIIKHDTFKDVRSANNFEDMITANRNKVKSQRNKIISK